MSYAWDFLQDDIKNDGDFSCCQTWTYGVVLMMVKFAEAYHAHEEACRSKAEMACDLQAAERPAK